MGRPASFRSSAAALAVALLAACQAAQPVARSLDPNAPVVIPYKVDGGGEIRFTVLPRYAAGGPVVLALDVTAGSVGIRGPVAARVLQSDLATGEQTVRRFAAGSAAVDVAAGTREHTTITWDGKNDAGAFVKAETYSVSLDFIVGAKTVALGSGIDVRDR